LTPYFSCQSTIIMKKIYLLIFTALVFNLNSKSQTFTLETDNTGLRCSYVLIDITASGFPANVAAITLFINVDGNVVHCIGNQSGTIGAGVNQSSYNQIAIAWFFDQGADINGRLLTLILHYDGGTTALDWNQPTCEVTLSDLSTVSCSYVDGSVSEGSYTFNTYYVDAARLTSGNGLSWGTAFKTITEAANLSLKPGEKVLIKPGNYPEKVNIKSDGGFSVWPQTGVILSDTNKITFPYGANLSCVDLVSYPDQYYAYVYRSWNSNNGYYKVIEVNDALNYVRVSGAAFTPEAGTNGLRSKVMAAVGRPVIYRKDPAALETERVTINAATLGTIADVLYIGKALGDGQTNADSCNFNIIEGIDITGSTNGKGLHIQCSAYNTYAKGKIYSSNGIGAIISGNSTRNAKFNIIQNCEIYNTPYQGVLLGYTTNALSNNYSSFNHVIDNNLYLSGTGTLARFTNAVKVGYNDKSNVIDGNNFHDMNIYTINNGALLVESKADSTLVYGNIFRNIGKVNTGTHACVMINDTISKICAYNNIIFNDDTVTNAVYAFRINGRKDTLSKVCFNTVYKIDNAFYLEDNSAGGATIDFAIQDNIISPTVTYFTNVVTSGRFTVTYNLFRSSIGAPYESGAGQKFGDPLFVDPNGPSMYGLTLMPGSPALNFGIAINNISRDYLKKSRTTPPTMGAFDKFLDCFWTGTVNTNWHNYLNWEYNIVPMNFMNVNVPNTTNDPIISTGNASCKSLHLETGATIRVQPPRIITVY
jgi:hypothetical protein